MPSMDYPIITPRDLRVDVYSETNLDEPSACYVVRTNIADDPIRSFDVVKFSDGQEVVMETTKSNRRI